MLRKRINGTGAGNTIINHQFFIFARNTYRWRKNDAYRKK
jgi:hypothetical protein